MKRLFLGLSQPESYINEVAPKIEKNWKKALEKIYAIINFILVCLIKKAKIYAFGMHVVYITVSVEKNYKIYARKKIASFTTYILYASEM